jgi:hypothetical protein
VAVGNERAHAARFGEPQRLAIMTLAALVCHFSLHHSDL